jgi:hypothetical protein
LRALVTTNACEDGNQIVGTRLRKQRLRRNVPSRGSGSDAAQREVVPVFRARV